MKLSCIIIDDEELARERLVNLVEKVAELDIIATCGTGKEAIAAINGKHPDIIFLDIKMKDMTGFDVLSKLVDPNPLIVFVTAYNKYAVKAFDLFAFDYLLKPFTKERFDKSIDKIRSHFNNKTKMNANGKMDLLLEHLKGESILEGKNVFASKIPIRRDNSIFFINTDDIKYILGSGSYVEIHTTTAKYIHRASLQHIIESTEDKNLIRIHRSTIINLKYLEQVKYIPQNRIGLKLIDGNEFRLSKRYKKVFQDTVGI